MQVTTKQADYQDDQDRQDLVRLLSEYARFEIGGDPAGLAELPEKLADFPTAFSVLAYSGGDAYSGDDESKAIGLINCFFGFSTFMGKRLVNIHDVIVTAEHRRKGVTTAMLGAVEQIARDHDCCRITLEVYSDHEPAVRAYHKYGFSRDPEHPTSDVWFLRKTLA